VLHVVNRKAKHLKRGECNRREEAFFPEDENQNFSHDLPDINLTTQNKPVQARYYSLVTIKGQSSSLSLVLILSYILETFPVYTMGTHIDTHGCVLVAGGMTLLLNKIISHICCVHMHDKYVLYINSCTSTHMTLTCAHKPECTKLENEQARLTSTHIHMTAI